MGTTKTALQAGSLTYGWVVVIEGYSHLLSNCTEAQVQAAWTGTDWASNTIIPGLTVDASLEQSIDPWDPFSNTGGTVSLSIKDSITDTFGVDTHKRNAGDETQLSVSLDSNDTTVAVLSTTGFASSGEAHIGTECFAYTGTGATTFTTVTRGKYSPFGVDGGTRFGRPHRVRNDPNAVTIKPLVTEHPRAWPGRMVGVWLHRVVGGVLDVKSEAQLIFAGRIVEVRDDPGSMSTVVQCEHILGHIADATLGREMFSAIIDGGVPLYTGNTFSMLDTLDFGPVGPSNADDLVVVASGASGHLEVNAGRYSVGELHSILNTWWSGERTAGNLDIDYEIALTTASDATVTRIWWYADGTAGDTGFWRFTMPTQVARFLGYNSQGITIGTRYSIFDDGAVDTQQVYDSNEPAKQTMIEYSSTQTLDLLEETGVFADQYASLPAIVKPITNQSLEWGLFVVDDKHVVVASKDGDQLTNVRISTLPIFGRDTGTTSGVDFPQIYRTIDEGGEVRVRQIFVFEADRATLLKQLFYSSGTSGYNHGTLDTLPLGIGLNIPGVLLGDTFEATLDAMPGANITSVIIIEEPTKFAEEMTTDLVTSWTFPVWKDQGLRFMVWPTPVTGAAVATLAESTKAAPAGQIDEHRTSTTLTDQWARECVKWRFDRTLAVPGEGATYLSSKTFEDPTAIDDAGGAGKPLTLELRHVFSDHVQTGVGVGQLVSTFLELMPMFSRGSRLSKRSIDPRFFEGYAPGDVVLVTDEFARDPDSGTRGTSRPGVIVSHWWQPGGGIPGQASEMAGGVTIMFLDQNRIAQYVPCAQVNEGSANGGYNAGTKVLTCHAHKHSESSEAADASYFVATSKVRVIEIDPSDPASPQSWDDTVASQTGNTITLTTGLAGWDSAKRYRVISDDYGDATATQQTTYTYQADDADGLVANARLPYQYAFGLFDITTVTANSSSDMLELPPNAAYGDGVGRDIGHEAALNRLCTNVLDFKAAHSTPVMSSAVMSGSAVSGTYRLVEVRPIFLGADALSTEVTRNVSVAPWIRSSDGASATVRVTLARTPPVTDSLNDVDRGAIYSEATFTRSSTTWITATPANLTASVKTLGGMAWILVECTVKAETRGLAKLQVSARSYA